MDPRSKSPPRLHLSHGAVVRPHWLTILLAGLAAALAFAPPAGAEAEQSSGVSEQQITEEVEKRGAGKKTEFVIAPLPTANPTFGYGLVVVGGVLTRLGSSKDVPPSVFGAAAFYFSNESKGGGVGGRTYFSGGRHRLSAGYGRFDVNYRFYGIGSSALLQDISIPIRHEGDGYFLEFSSRVAGPFRLGGELGLANMTTSVTIDLPPELEDLDLSFDSQLTWIGLNLERDTRDNLFGPRTGSLLKLSLRDFDESWGSDFTYMKYDLGYNLYFNIRADDVLAARFYACSAGEGAPFFALCSLGGKSALRGYSAGRHQDNRLAAIQAEYRWQFARRFSAVGFAGFGGVAPEFGELDGSDILPSVGVGLRFMAAKQNRVNIRVDYAWGDEDEALYFAVGEAF